MQGADPDSAGRRQLTPKKAHQPSTVMTAIPIRQICLRGAWNLYRLADQTEFGVDRERYANVRGLIKPSASMPFLL